jgi:hypothetical protein
MSVDTLAADPNKCVNTFHLNVSAQTPTIWEGVEAAAQQAGMTLTGPQIYSETGEVLSEQQVGGSGASEQERWEAARTLPDGYTFTVVLDNVPCAQAEDPVISTPVPPSATGPAWLTGEPTVVWPNLVPSPSATTETAVARPAPSHERPNTDLMPTLTVLLALGAVIAGRAIRRRFGSR